MSNFHLKLSWKSFLLKLKLLGIVSRKERIEGKKIKVLCVYKDYGYTETQRDEAFGENPCAESTHM